MGMQGGNVSDTSFYDARIHQEQMQTEQLRQEAAQLEAEYWRLKLAQIKQQDAGTERGCREGQ
jgi:hypothetical protein